MTKKEKEILNNIPLILPVFTFEGKRYVPESQALFIIAEIKKLMKEKN